MNNVDKVFSIIKRDIEKQRRFAEINDFENIAMGANVHVNLLPQYLAVLQDRGLIKYSLKDKYIHLTALGKKHKIVAEPSLAFA